MRRKWVPNVNHKFEPVSSVKKSIILASLSEIIYKEFSNFRELQNQRASSIAARSDDSHKNESERKVSNG